MLVLARWLYLMSGRGLELDSLWADSDIGWGSDILMYKDEKFSSWENSRENGRCPQAVE